MAETNFMSIQKNTVATNRMELQVGVLRELVSRFKV